MIRFIIYVVIILILASFLAEIQCTHSYTFDFNSIESLREDLFNYTWVRKLNIQTPAVSSNNIGILSNITLILAYPGHGYVYFTALPFTELDTQISMRTATWVASVITNKIFNNYDYYILMKADYPIIGGPSASALVTIGFIALFLNVSIKPYVTMTGMINPDGTIGFVGGLKEKIEIAAQREYRVFMIPRGQRTYRYPFIYEEKYPWGVIRKVEYRTVDLVEYGRTLNISVIEVGNVIEAFLYASEYKLNTVEEAILTHSELLNSFVRNESVYVINNVENELVFIKQLINRIKNPLDKYLVEDTYRQYFNQYTVLKNILYNNKTYYCLIKSIELLSEITRLYWFLKLYHNEVSIDYIIYYVNNTLVNTFIDLNKSISLIDDYEKLVLFSIAYSYFKLSGFYMIEAINTYRSGDLDNTLSNIEKVVYYNKICEELINLFKQLTNSSRLVKLSPIIIENIYNLAHTAYSYAYTLSKDTGSALYLIDTLTTLYSILNEEKNIYNVIGTGLLLVAYSSSSIHLLSDNKFLNNTWYSTLGVLYRYLYLLRNMTLIEELFYRFALESVEQSDFSSVLINICIVNTLLQTRIIYNMNIGEVIELPQLTPLNTAFTKVTKTNTVTQPSPYVNISEKTHFIVLIIIATALLISSIIIIYVTIRYRKFSKTRY